MKSFKTHTGRIVESEELQYAIYAVNNDLINLAYAIRTEDAYTSHITE